MSKIGLMKFALLAVGALGGGLLLAGMLSGMQVLSLAGFSLWIFVLMALSYGNRLKLHQCFAFAERNSLLAAQNAEQARLLVMRSTEIETSLRVLGKSVSDSQHLYLRGHTGIDKQIRELLLHSDRNVEILRAQSELAFKEIWAALQVPGEAVAPASNSVGDDAGDATFNEGALLPLGAKPIGMVVANLTGLVKAQEQVQGARAAEWTVALTGVGAALQAAQDDVGQRHELIIRALRQGVVESAERSQAQLMADAGWREKVESALLPMQLQKIVSAIAGGADQTTLRLQAFERELEVLVKQLTGDHAQTVELLSAGSEVVNSQIGILAQQLTGDTANVLERIASTEEVLDAEIKALVQRWSGDSAAVLGKIDVTGSVLGDEIRALAEQWNGESVKLLAEINSSSDTLEQEIKALTGQWSDESEKLLTEIGSTGHALDREIKALAEQWSGGNEKLAADIGAVGGALDEEIKALAEQWSGESERLLAEIGSTGTSLELEIKALAQHWRDENANLLDHVGSAGDVFERELQALAKQRLSDNASIGADIGRELNALTQRWLDGNAETGAQIGLCQEQLQRIQSVMDESCKSVADFIQDDERLRDVTKRGMQWVKYETVQEVESLLQLNKLFPETSDISLLGGWAMDPAAMLAVLKMILREQPAVIVECGSGTSTVWIAYALKKLGRGKLISIDHSAEYASKTRAELVRLNLTEFVDVRVGALEDVEINGAKFTWYSVAVLEGIDVVDMLIVDGPPGSSGELARYPAVPLLAAALQPAAYVIVDDAKRPMEKKIMNRWRREFCKLGSPSWVASRTAALTWDHSA